MSKRTVICWLLAFILGPSGGAVPAVADSLEPLAPVTGTQPGEWELVGQFSLFSPLQLSFSTDRFVVPWEEGATSSPTFSVGFATPVFRWGDVQGLAQATFGYGFKKSWQRLLARDGGRTQQKLVELHRIPLLASLKFVYRIGGRGDVKPTLTLGAGAQGWYQRGDLPGLTRLQWVPYYVISPALTFFEREWEKDWFAGFTFGVSYHNALRARTFSAWSFDLSLNILLL